VDSSDIVTVLRLVTSIGILACASVLDWRTRRVGNAYWVALSVIGMVLIPVQISIDERPWEYALILVPILAILSDVYLDSGNEGKLAGIMPLAKYAIAIGSLVVLGYLWLDNPYFPHLFMVPVLMLLIVIMYVLDLIRGGADAKALLALSIVFPTYPVISSLPLIGPETTDVGLVMPFTFAVLVTAAIIVAILPVGFAVRNLAAREFKLPYGFLGYKMDIATLKGKHVWLMENVEDGKLVMHTRPRRNEDLDKELELLKTIGTSRVWITPKVPFIIPITASLVFTALVGNLLFLILNVTSGNL
jgi:archaeal preflagellin peptidase FlaK